MKHLKILSLLLFGLAILVTGCEKGMWKEQEEAEIKNYIRSLQDTVYVLYPSGLYQIDLVEGTGAFPADYDTVYFKYKIRFLNYVTFNTNDPIGTPYMHIMGTDVGPVELGIEEGLRYMRAGGITRFLTPSKLAFGHEGIPSYVPGYTPLLWDIDLDSVVAGPGN
jgi:FKBP-type peptidyl-prolyl cis-trans isomerase